MGWRSIVISHPSKLSVKDNQLIIEQEEKWSMPIEDLISVFHDRGAKIYITTNS